MIRGYIYDPIESSATVYPLLCFCVFKSGGWLHPEAVESRNMHLQEYPCASINRNSSMVHPSTSFNHHQRVPRAPGMQVHPYNQQAEPIELLIFPEASYFGDSVDEDDGSEFDYWQYGMSMDVEHMSYEELLDMEEHMGHVCTGLSEESIMKNLKIQAWAPLFSLSLSDILPELLDETCAICLEKFQVLEMIGSLDCGHSYHIDCIKQWLSIKNLCPRCRETALATAGRDS